MFFVISVLIVVICICIASIPLPPPPMNNFTYEYLIGHNTERCNTEPICLLKVYKYNNLCTILCKDCVTPCEALYLCGKCPNYNCWRCENVRYD